MLRLTENFEDYRYSTEFFYSDRLDPNIIYNGKLILAQILRTSDIQNYKIIDTESGIQVFFKHEEDQYNFYTYFDRKITDQTAEHLFGTPKEHAKTFYQANQSPLPEYQ